MDIVLSMHLGFYPPNVFLFVGSGTGSSSASKPAHVSCFIWRDLRDKTTYWLSNRIPAVDLRSLTFHFAPVPSLSLSLSLTLSNSVPLPSFLPLSLTGLPPGCLLQSVWSWSSNTADFSSTWNSATWNLPEVWHYKALSPRWFHPQWLLLTVSSACVYIRCQGLSLLWSFILYRSLLKSCMWGCGIISVFSQSILTKLKTSGMEKHCRGYAEVVACMSTLVRNHNKEVTGAVF